MTHFGMEGILVAEFQIIHSFWCFIDSVRSRIQLKAMVIRARFPTTHFRMAGILAAKFQNVYVFKGFDNSLKFRAQTRNGSIRTFGFGSRPNCTFYPRQERLPRVMMISATAVGKDNDRGQTSGQLFPAIQRAPALIFYVSLKIVIGSNTAWRKEQSKKKKGSKKEAKTYRRQPISLSSAGLSILWL